MGSVLFLNFCVSKINLATLGMKISAKKIVVSMNIPATNIPVPMLMYDLRENVTSARTTSTILEM